MKAVLKHNFKSILIFLSSGLYFFLVYIGYKSQNIDLSTLSSHIGVVENLGETYNYGSKGRKSIVFFVDVKGLSQRLGIYRKDKDYNDLHRNILIGDKIRVFYLPNKSDKNINIDLVQIEKRDSIIYSKNEYEKKEGALIWIGLIFGFLSILFSWLYYKKKLVGMK